MMTMMSWHLGDFGALVIAVVNLLSYYYMDVVLNSLGIAEQYLSADYSPALNCYL